MEYLNPINNIVPLMDHKASSINAFSSFINNSDFFEKCQDWQQAKIEKNQIILHFMDSIHRAGPNKDFKKAAFLVFRFDRNKIEIDDIKNKYKKVFSKYLSNIKNSN